MATFDPAPPLLDHNLYRYQMSGGPSYVGQDNPQVQQQTDPLAAIFGLRHRLPSVAPLGGPQSTAAIPLGQTADELTAQGFRTGDFPPPGANRGEPTPAGPPGFDQNRFDGAWQGMDVSGSTFDPEAAAMPMDAAPPAAAAEPSLRERLAPILNGLGAGVAANNMAAGIPVMNYRRDVAAQRKRYDDAVAYKRQQDEQALALDRQKRNATVGFLAKQFGEDDPRVQLARQNPDAVAFLLPNLKEIGSVRTEYLNSPIVKEYDIIDMQYANVLDAAASAKTDKTGMSAIKLVYSYMKMLDPNSAIRENEVAMPNNVGNVPDRVWNLYNRMMKGKQYDANKVLGFVREAADIHARSTIRLVRHNQYYQGIRDSAQMDPRLFPLRQPSRYPEPEKPQMTPSPLPGPRLVPGDPGAPIPTQNPDVTITPGRH
jgi:hypothetical protein